jgi:hypothetical protein
MQPQSAETPITPCPARMPTSSRLRVSVPHFGSTRPTRDTPLPSGCLASPRAKSWSLTMGKGSRSAAEFWAPLLLPTTSGAARAPKNGRQPKDIMDHAQEYDRYHSGIDYVEGHKPARLRRSRSVRSPRPRALTRAIERGADPRQAVTQWQACGGSMEQLRKNAQARR